MLRHSPTIEPMSTYSVRDRLGLVLAVALAADGVACSTGDECTQRVTDRVSTVAVDLDSACTVERAFSFDRTSLHAHCQKACGDDAVASCLNETPYRQAYTTMSQGARRTPDTPCPSPQLLDGGTTVQLTCTVSHDEPIAGSKAPCGTGRRPEGLEPCSSTASNEVGSWFADGAYLEAASVSAFRILAEELVLHDAPAHLIEASIRAARDEERHASMMTAMARRSGAAVSAPRHRPRRRRTLFEVALENAREGVVRETYGAAVMLLCAHRALDPAMRSSFASIARDECDHAELSMAIDEWARGRLAESDNEALAAAIGDEYRALKRAVLAPASPQLVREIGVPTAAESARIVEAIAATLWSHGPAWRRSPACIAVSPNVEYLAAASHDRS